MNTTGVTEGPYLTFKEETEGQLDGKEGYLVELGTAAESVKILATVGNEIGTYEGRLSADSNYVRVRLLGTPGTARFVANGVIAKDGKFIAAAGGKVAPVGSATSGIILGRSLYQGNTADDQRFLAMPSAQRHKPAAASHIADASEAHAIADSFDDEEVEAALDTLGGKINAILAVLEGNDLTETS
jgi:hypothetical protein